LPLLVEAKQDYRIGDWQWAVNVYFCCAELSIWKFTVQRQHLAYGFDSMALRNVRSFFHISIFSKNSKCFRCGDRECGCV